MDPPLILVVDDHALMRTAVSSTLISQGFDVISAESGRRALETLGTTADVKCVLLDLSMPEMPGEEVVENLASNRPELPIIVYSAYDRSAVPHVLAHNNVADYLQKPFDPDTLETKLKTAIASKEDRRSGLRRTSPWN